MHRRDLHNDRLFILRRFLERIDELAEIFNGIDIVVRRGGDGVRALGDHAGHGNVSDDLRAGQMPADARLRALPHLDLDGGARVQTALLDAEAAGGHLYDRVCAVLIEITVQSALAGIVIDAKLLGGAGKRCVRVIADRAVAHRGKEDRNRELQLRRERRVKRAVGPAADRVRLLAEKDARLHRLAQRIDRGVRDLRGVDEKPVPVARQRRRIAGGGEENAARGGLLVYLADRVALPVFVLAQAAVGFYDLDRARRTERNAPLAVDAFGLVREHDLSLGVVGVDAVRALLFADAAARAPLVAPDDLKRRVDVFDSHFRIFPPLRAR